MDIRRAAPSDAGLLATHRAAVWCEVGDWTPAELAPQIPIWEAFFHARVAEGSYVAFVAESDGAVVGSGGLLIYLAIPRPGLASDRAGRVQSIYVEAPARRRGVARAIVERIVDFARDASLISLTLHPSEQGRPLYVALGFQPADEMLLRFSNG